MTPSCRAKTDQILNELRELFGGSESREDVLEAFDEIGSDIEIYENALEADGE